MTITKPARMVADQISRWPDTYKVTLPDDLHKAIETFELIKWTEVGHRPAFDLKGLTQKNAEQKIREFAAALSVTDNREGGSAIDRAKSIALETAAREVIRLAADAADGVIDQMMPTLQEAAAAYVAAVDLLPNELTTENLVEAGPSAVAAYGQAQAAVGPIVAVINFVQELKDLPGYAPNGSAPWWCYDIGSSTTENAVVNAVGGHALLAAARDGFSVTDREAV